MTLKRFEKISTPEWEWVMARNVCGSVECARAGFPATHRQRHGKIINVASEPVFKGTPTMLPYVASEGAIVALARRLAHQAGDGGICRNCLALGLPMSASVKANADCSRSIIDNNIGSRCLKREATPDDLTGAFNLSRCRRRRFHGGRRSSSMAARLLTDWKTAMENACDWIGGEWTGTAAAENVDPADGSMVGKVADGGAAEAVAKANRNRCGSSAGFWTHDGARAMRVAHVLRGGTVWINEHDKPLAEAEAGGDRQSSMGRHDGAHALDDFSEFRHVSFPASAVGAVR